MQRRREAQNRDTAAGHANRPLTPAKVVFGCVNLCLILTVLLVEPLRNGLLTVLGPVAAAVLVIPVALLLFGVKRR
ncbi:hypothetical protein [Actinoplanes sp. NPDC026670]|uniref:hypothetical protein n=1 Tax=Actinoplanes sp. NPDC026670 TaxID=3154700 RepID=UPI0033E002DC